jgi:hypothetical protein
MAIEDLRTDRERSEDREEPNYLGLARGGGLAPNRGSTGARALATPSAAAAQPRGRESPGGGCRTGAPGGGPRPASSIWAGPSIWVGRPASRA